MSMAGGTLVRVQLCSTLYEAFALTRLLPENLDDVARRTVAVEARFQRSGSRLLKAIPDAVTGKDQPAAAFPQQATSVKFTWTGHRTSRKEGSDYFLSVC
jgi:hypothetical protein